MIRSLAGYAVTAATLVTGGGLALVAAQAPAYAGGFSTVYSCDVPMLGSTTVVLDGWLSSPGQTAVTRPTGVRLHLSRLAVNAPVPIGSWSASAWINVGGAENTAFRVAGAGGYVPVGQPIRGDLTGDWTPAVGGTDTLSVGRLKITTNSPAIGTVTARCVPNDQSAAETLAVLPSYHPGWSGPIVPPYAGWARPVAPYRPSWRGPLA
ncbi:hypothetical protein OG417_34900 [Actinoallomurus sp. NBC_01490]|jgi:hypothetical protein|uniref:hypothetical protein n=1 Tax=Actinoallomurus sp. NBC_01490 TaxID=2903557 RepID=UPI002E30E0F2|nr:hypothetical protein [Actinoallomurus sp. NBC_01490]